MYLICVLCTHMCVCTCQCSSFSSLLLEASPQVHSALQNTPQLSLCIFLIDTRMTLCTMRMCTYIIIFIKNWCQPMLFWWKCRYRFFGFLEQVGNTRFTGKNSMCFPRILVCIMTFILFTYKNISYANVNIVLTSAFYRSLWMKIQHYHY